MEGLFLMDNNKENLKKGSSVIILDASGKFLAVSRPFSEKIGFPGGKREPGESALENAIRELQEETSLVVSTDDLVHVFEGICPGETDYWVDCFFVRYNEKMGVAKKMEDGINISWLDAEDFVSNGAFVEYNKMALSKIKVFV